MLEEDVRAEGVGEESADGGGLVLAAVAGVEDGRAVVAELGEGLAAGAAGHGGCAVEVGDGDGEQADARTVFDDGAGDGGLLGAAGEAVAAVFDVAAGDDGAICKQESGADAEPGVRRVRVLGGREGGRAERECLCFGEGAERVGALCRHESFRVRLLRAGKQAVGDDG